MPAPQYRPVEGPRFGSSSYALAQGTHLIGQGTSGLGATLRSIGADRLARSNAKKTAEQAALLERASLGAQTQNSFEGLDSYTRELISSGVFAPGIAQAIADRRTGIQEQLTATDTLLNSASDRATEAQQLKEDQYAQEQLELDNQFIQTYGADLARAQQAAVNDDFAGAESIFQDLYGVEGARVNVLDAAFDDLNAAFSARTEAVNKNNQAREDLRGSRITNNGNQIANSEAQYDLTKRQIEDQVDSQVTALSSLGEFTGKHIGEAATLMRQVGQERGYSPEVINRSLAALQSRADDDGYVGISRNVDPLVTQQVDSSLEGISFSIDDAIDRAIGANRNAEQNDPTLKLSLGAERIRQELASQDGQLEPAQYLNQAVPGLDLDDEHNLALQELVKDGFTMEEVLIRAQQPGVLRDNARRSTSLNVADVLGDYLGRQKGQIVLDFGRLRKVLDAEKTTPGQRNARLQERNHVYREAESIKDDFRDFKKDAARLAQKRQSANDAYSLSQIRREEESLADRLQKIMNRSRAMQNYSGQTPEYHSGTPSGPNEYLNLIREIGVSKRGRPPEQTE